MPPKKEIKEEQAEIEQIKEALKKGENPNVLLRKYKDSFSTVNFLLKEKAEVFPGGKCSICPTNHLSHEFQSPNDATVRITILNTQLMESSSNSLTPLDIALEHPLGTPRLDIVKYLLSKNARPSFPLTLEEFNKKHAAEVVKSLGESEAKAEVTVHNKTPLEAYVNKACARDHSGVVKFLVEHKAQPSAPPPAETEEDRLRKIAEIASVLGARP